MSTAADFTAQEWDLLCALPFVVAGTSLVEVHPSALKAIKAGLSIYPIVRDTSKQFPANECIQAIMTSHSEQHVGNNELIQKHEGSGNEAAIALRNEMCEKANSILGEKSQPEETAEYKRWLLQIATETMHKAQSNGFLGLGKGRAEAEVAQALQAFKQVLHSAE
jgi:hypothetical protein